MGIREDIEAAKTQLSEGSAGNDGANRDDAGSAAAKAADAFGKRDAEPAKEPAAREPAAREPAAKEPAAKEPAGKEPAAGSAAKEAAKEHAKQDPATLTLDEIKLIDPPARWSKKDKEEWAKLQEFAKSNPELGKMIAGVQGILANRNKSMEGDFTKKMMEVANERGRYQQMDQVLEPMRETWKRAGVSEAQAVAGLLAYWQAAEKNFPAFLEQVARERNFDLAQYVLQTRPHLRAASGAQPNGQGGELPEDIPVHPVIQRQLQALGAEVQRLQQGQQQHSQHAQRMALSEEQRMGEQAAADYQAFVSATDPHGQPLHPFIDDVREDMADLIMSVNPRTGKPWAASFKEAYDLAVRMNPAVSAKLRESEEIAAQQRAEEARRADERKRQADADRARRAGASVGGSTLEPPPAGASGQEGNLSLRDEIRRAARMVAQRSEARV